MRNSIFITIFLLFFAILAAGLYTNTKEIQSPLIGQQIPIFNLPNLNSGSTLTNKSLPNEPYLINVWASWCLECIKEHNYLKNIQNINIKIIGINYKDTRNDALGWLGIYGNPYQFSIFDENGSLGLEMGVYGVPETFIIDTNGVIIDKFVGALNENDIRTKIIPQILDTNSNKN